MCNLSWQCQTRTKLFYSQIIETRLKMTLPEDIASALTDGVILCHLANYVRPRSVASIHVPSPGVVSFIDEKIFSFL